MDKGCPFLKPDGEDFICKASKTNMSPSLFEFNIYCTKEDHYRCPLLLARSSRDGFMEAIVKAGAVLSR